MNGEVENKSCAKCRSPNPAGVTHCRYCHHSLAPLKTFAEQAEPKEKRFNTKLLLAGGSALAVVTRYVFRKRRLSPKKKAG